MNPNGRNWLRYFQLDCDRATEVVFARYHSQIGRISHCAHCHRQAQFRSLTLGATWNASQRQAKNEDRNDTGHAVITELLRTTLEAGCWSAFLRHTSIRFAGFYTGICDLDLS